ncbi:MAG: carbohydrate binding domain-containing protein [Clostridium sp.]|uniref:carbohydrate binding domain-containing protein n=1 Tax=Clostridium sp. TaxID=1506 RepID=UPI002901BD90|nr:carbohydrate binding domain-containing protein [Clostridium sp.]MDU2755682.1 carbohydrate binding domain-containing protein [Clostridium sp.]MDU2901892.1 carbohydrate binding domain-containing protein [Clostridium sp.]
MYTTSTAYKTEIQKRSRTFECRVTIGDRVFTNNEVQSIDLNGGIQDVFSIGNTPSMCLELVLRNTTDTIFTTNSVKVEIGLKIVSTIEYVPLGIFNVEDIKKDDYTTKFTCYDNMTKFEIAYFSSLGDNPTLQQVVNELATKTGVQFTGTLPAYNVKKLEGFTCREVLGYVASLCGGNALITRDGNFTIVYPTDISRDVGEGVFDLQRDEVKYKVGKITCQVKEQETISKGSLGTDNMELSFENPWVTETILTDIYNRLNGFNYLGYTMKWQGDLSLDIGDIITYTDAKKVTRKLPILYRKLSYDGGLDSELSAKGETKNKNSFNSSGSMSNKLNRVVTEVAIVNKAFIDYANINDANIKNLQAETAKIHNLEVETANINNILAGNIGSGSVQTIHLTGKNVVIDNAVIKSAMIDSLDLNKLNAGTISTNKFSISSTDGGLNIVGPTIQWKDKNNKIRMQAGKDAQGNFTFLLVGEDGTTALLDQTGIKKGAIANDLIVSDMISENAIGEKQINYSSLITGLNKDDNTSLIKASKVAIDLTGQSLEVAFNSLKSNVDDMEIGGRNLLQNSNFAFELDGWYKHDYHTVEIVKDSTYGNVVKMTALDNNIGGIFKPPTVKFKNEEVYTMSVYVKSSVVGSQIGIAIYGNGISEGKIFTIGVANEWVKLVSTFKVSGINPNIRVYSVRSSGCVFHIANIKVEKGNKPTDWTPAPEDTDKVTQSLQTQITANLKGIETLVKDTTIKQDGNTVKLQDFYSSFIQTKDEISRKVTQAEIDSSINKIQIGSTNLLRNTGIEKDISYFTLANGVTRDTSVKCLGTNTFKYDINGLTEDRWSSANPSTVDIVEGEKYSASGYINIASAAINNTTSFALEIQWFDASGERISSHSGDVIDKSIRNKWQLIKCEGKVAPAGAVKANCRIYVRRNGMCWVGRLQLEKGTKCSDWSSSPKDTEQRVNTVEEKMTATGVITTITEAINKGTNSLTTMQFILDKNGATIKNGALRILNKAGTEVLKGDSNGNLTMIGNFINTDINGNPALEIVDSTIYFYDFVKKKELTGLIYSSVNSSGDTGIGYGHEKNKILAITGKLLADEEFPYKPYVSFDMYNLGGRRAPFSDSKMIIHQELMIDAKSRLYDSMLLDSSWGDIRFTNYSKYGDNPAGVVKSIQWSSNGKTYTDACILGRRGSDPRANAYCVVGQLSETDINTYYRTIVVSSSGVEINGNFKVNGTKNRVVDTDGFGRVCLSAYETAGSYFGDLGNGILDEEGICYIFFDKCFLSTVNTEFDYFVMLQKYGQGDVWVEKREKDYFIVKGTPNLQFGWEVKCKQIGYEVDNLREDFELSVTKVYGFSSIKEDTDNSIMSKKL